MRFKCGKCGAVRPERSPAPGLLGAFIDWLIEEDETVCGACGAKDWRIPSFL